jgi:hypothetical protein
MEDAKRDKYLDDWNKKQSGKPLFNRFIENKSDKGDKFALMRIKSMMSSTSLS